MGFLDKLVRESIDTFLDHYEDEVKSLKEDMVHLYDKKRRKRWGKTEHFAVTLAYNYVNDYLENFKCAYLGHYGKLPDDVVEKLKKLIDLLEDVNSYIIDHFEDDIVSSELDDEVKGVKLDDLLPYLF